MSVLSKSRSLFVFISVLTAFVSAQADVNSELAEANAKVNAARSQVDVDQAAALKKLNAAITQATFDANMASKEVKKEENRALNQLDKSDSIADTINQIKAASEEKYAAIDAEKLAKVTAATAAFNAEVAAAQEKYRQAVAVYGAETEQICLKYTGKVCAVGAAR